VGKYETFVEPEGDLYVAEGSVRNYFLQFHKFTTLYFRAYSSGVSQLVSSSILHIDIYKYATDT